MIAAKQCRVRESCREESLRSSIQRGLLHVDGEDLPTGTDQSREEHGVVTVPRRRVDGGVSNLDREANDRVSLFGEWRHRESYS